LNNKETKEIGLGHREVFALKAANFRQLVSQLHVTGRTPVEIS
jgi:hypothetical protein